MKKITRLLIVGVLFAASGFYSCKSKTTEPANTPAATVSADTPTSSMQTAPVEVASDDVLKKGVTDAVKDYPSVKADVTDSVINLSGEIKRADWQKLNPTLNTLHPKRVNSTNLTIK